MKKILSLLTVSVFSLSVATAQQPSEGFYISYETGSSTHSKNFQTIDMNGTVNYLFRSGFFGGVSMRSAAGLFYQEGAKRFEYPLSLGVEGGYEFYNSSGGNLILDVRLSAARSIHSSFLASGNESDWKMNTYGLGIYCNFAPKIKSRPFIGIGCKYFDSRNPLYKNYFCFSVAVGFTISSDLW